MQLGLGRAGMPHGASQVNTEQVCVARQKRRQALRTLEQKRLAPDESDAEDSESDDEWK